MYNSTLRLEILHLITATIFLFKCSSLSSLINHNKTGILLKFWTLSVLQSTRFIVENVLEARTRVSKLSLMILRDLLRKTTCRHDSWYDDSGLWDTNLLKIIARLISLSETRPRGFLVQYLSRQVFATVKNIIQDFTWNGCLE